MAGTWGALRLFAVYALATLLRTTLARRTILQGAFAPAAALASVTEYTWHVTLSSQAPDCFQRSVILVNGSFQPTLEVVQGDFLKVNVINDIPADFPSAADGISIHWHGFSMRGNEWYDGTGHIAQCPILPGANFTYYFQVNEAAGSYLWHDHSGSNKADGLQGALIVHAKGPEPWTYDEERTLFLTDWFHGEANALLFALNRPFVPASQTPATGQWNWVGLPQAILINGKGFYGDCDLIGGLSVGAGVAEANPSCNVTTAVISPGKSVQQPWASPGNPGCSHENITVTAGKTYRVRIINGGSLLYQTVCFEGHNVTIIAGDATPTEPISFGPCVDINSGQRYDVLLTANATVGNYWVTAQPQYRMGSPNGFAVLQYEGADETLGLPATPTPQPGAVAPWTEPQAAMVVTAASLVNLSSSSNASGLEPVVTAAALALAAPLNSTTLQVPQKATRTITQVVTQPILNSTGQLRWAMNNIANSNTPPCEAPLSLVYSDNNYFTNMAAASGTSGTVDENLQSVNKSSPLTVFLDDGSTPPVYPSTGQHIINLDIGDVVDVIMTNEPGDSFNGDLTAAGMPGGPAARNTTEQHPFHLHGHHFWVLGSGFGPYNSSVEATLNLVNPMYRDTQILPEGGWTVIRFVADNPGLWFYHCHIIWHQLIGQGLIFAEGLDQIGTPPAELAECSQQCNYDFGPFDPEWVAENYGNTTYDLPGIASAVAA
ncbi:TPA: hypothetical protein ACH3X3_012965 [Trebouxia sp. C0006]